MAAPSGPGHLINALQLIKIIAERCSSAVKRAPVQRFNHFAEERETNPKEWIASCFLFANISLAVRFYRRDCFL